MDPSQRLDHYLLILADLIADVAQATGHWYGLRRLAQDLEWPLADDAVVSRLDALKARLGLVLRLIRDVTRRGGEEVLPPVDGDEHDGVAADVAAVYPAHLDRLCRLGDVVLAVDWLDEGALRRAVDDAGAGTATAAP